MGIGNLDALNPSVCSMCSGKGVIYNGPKIAWVDCPICGIEKKEKK